MFSAPVLARIAEGPSETTDAQAMQLSDLFSWVHASIYRELAAHAGSIDPLRRTLQQRCLDHLIALYTSPDADAPEDARALARVELRLIEQQAGSDRGKASDATTRAHLELLEARAHQALTPR